MLAGLIARARSAWHGVRHTSDIDADMQEEFRAHLALREDDLMRAGLSPAAAARQARLEFGSPDRYRDEGRASRGLRRFDQMRVSWLDFKLGFRMLARYPGLTLVGGLAMAFAIWVGAGTFELTTRLVRPTLPFHDGDRIVGIRTWDAAANRPEARVAHDFLTWRTELKTVRQLGAFRAIKRNLITGDGRGGEPANIAEISASAFGMTGVPPLLGRSFVESDERPDAPSVVLIGYDLWHARFGGDRSVVGRSVRLGNVQTTIIGVMPKRYAFPISDNLWIPLRLTDGVYAPREGPGLQVFGRLAPGATISEAQAELTTVGTRASADLRATHEHLRPQVIPYSRLIFDLSGWRMAAALSVNVPLVLFVMLVCANVALLMFARAATRESELVVRSALGASRGRIITQLFAEALVLGGLAAIVGLGAVQLGLLWVVRVVEGEILDGGKLPFWFHDGLSPLTVLYALLLTVFGACIAGVVPGLKVTRGMGERLRRTTAGGGGLQFGGVWTAVIVIQIAVTVAFPLATYMVRRDAVYIRSVDVGFPDEQYLTVHLEMDRENESGAVMDTSRAAFASRFRATYEDLERRLLADPAVAGITFADRLPRMYHPHRLIEVDAGGATPLHPEWPGYRVSTAAVGPTFFDVFHAPILGGRAFTSSEHEAGRGDPATADARGGPVIVNQSFVKLVLGNRNPVGRRVRFIRFEEHEVTERAKTLAPWYDIVGVVQDMGMTVDGHDPKRAGIYLPVPPGGAYPAEMAVQVRGDPAAFVPTLRAIATAADPTLRLHDFMPLARVNDAELQFYAYWTRLLLVVSGIALTLSLAGIYSVMAFTVARRTREIGIRVALGGNPRRVVVAILKRPLIQVTLGIVVGGALIAALVSAASSGGVPMEHVAMIAAYLVGMLCICLLACIVPTRRALRVQPIEALRTDD
ncbi:MAG: ABC transporter permease [Gemmatimonadaceae bacterium]